jgi:hypothetical protein
VGDTRKTDRGDVPAGLDGLDDMDLPERRTPGRDARDSAPLGSRETLQRLLADDSLGVTEDDARGTTQRIQPNPAGLKKGYDPYDSGMLMKKQWKRKKDLRALSEWIEKKKKQAD